jgi:hypothetical protein
MTLSDMPITEVRTIEWMAVAFGALVVLALWKIGAHLSSLAQRNHELREVLDSIELLLTAHRVRGR